VDYSTAFADVAFDSPAGMGDSFGGQITSPMQFNSPHGAFESQPHDVVHVALAGLMGDPDTAAQDPIFWLHHANVDRMWNQWIAQGGGRADAADAAWLNTQFTFYDEAGHAVYLTGAEVVDTVGQLNYRYDDDPTTMMMHGKFPRPLATQDFTEAKPPVVAGAAAPEASREPVLKLAKSTNSKPFSLAGITARMQVPLTKDAIDQMQKLAANKAIRKVFVRLDDIHYDKSSGVYYEVYINPPAGKKLDIKAPGYVGNLALFGFNPHAMAGRPAPAGDIFIEYDISRLVSAALAGNPKDLTVVLVPRGLFDLHGNPLPVSAKAQATVGSAIIIGR
jgi:tyrosinase